MTGEINTLKMKNRVEEETKQKRACMIEKRMNKQNMIKLDSKEENREALVKSLSLEIWVSTCCLTLIYRD